MADPILSLLDPRLQQALLDSSAGFSSFREVQAKAIPVLSAGTNALVIAGTAGGKTEAALWPTLSRITRMPAGPGARLLLVAPLKALLNDLEPRARRWAGVHGMRCFKWHGDVSGSRKAAEEVHGSEVLLTTPESLEVIASLKKSVGSFFPALECVVVDEAHSFAAGARGSQLVCLLERIANETGRDFQRVGLSATVGNPERVLEWLVGANRTGEVVRVPAATSDERVEVRLHASAPETARFLVETCGGHRSIVFVPTRHEAERLSTVFADHEVRVPRDQIGYDVHHGSVAKQRREEAEIRIKVAGEEGKRTIISTATLELGIDIGELDETVEIGPPPSVSSHLQRLGRTGRRSGVRTTHIVLDEVPDDALKTTTAVLLSVAIARLGSRREVEEIEPSRSAYGAMAHQLLCLAVARHGVTESAAFEMIAGADPAREVSRSDFQNLTDHMLAQELLRRVDALLLLGPQAEREFGRSHFRKLCAVFDSPTQYVVKHGSQEIGSLDRSYVSTKKVPFVIILAGRHWEVTKRDDQRRILTVQATPRATAPRWSSPSPNFPISRLVAQEVRRLISELPDVRLDGIALNDRARGWLLASRESESWPIVETAAPRVMANSRTSATAWTYSGDRDNFLLGLVFESRGLRVVDFDPWSVQVISFGGDAALEVDEALREIPSTSSTAAWEVSVRAAQMLAGAYSQKFDNFVPKQLLTSELARGVASFQHLRRAFGDGSG